MREFLLVSKNLEIKELSTGIEMNDHVESNDENNVAYGNLDITRAPKDYLHVVPQTQTEQITPNNAANRRVGSAEVVSGDEKFQCQHCEKMFRSSSNVQI